MRILMIEGSPHRHGSSNLLADSFRRGAEEAGHTVEVFDAAHSDIHPCMGCDRCGMSGPCAFDDDFPALREALLETDMVVFVTPLYYFGMSAQLKAVIDRFYAFNGRLTSKHLKSALIVAAWDREDWIMEALVAHYRTICRYLGMDNQGEVLGKGCGTVSMTSSSGYPAEALAFGRSLR